MITWDDALQDCQDLSGDTTSATLAFFKRQMNKGYKLALAELNRPVTEITRTIPTNTPSVPLANKDRIYMLGPDALWPRSVKILIGSRWQTLDEEPSQDLWNMRTEYMISGIPTTYFVREYFGIGGKQVLLDPIPVAGYTLEIVYEATDKDLKQSAVTVGVASVNYGSNTVTGVGTAWTTAMVGRYFQSTDPTSDGMLYRIIDVPNSTTLTLLNNYQGSYNQSSVGYSINEVFALPEDAQEVPVHFAMSRFYATKKNAEKVAEYMQMFNTDLKASKDRWAKKTDTGRLTPRRRYGGFRAATPSWFPDGGVSS